MNVLFVCSGNVSRSFLAEALLRHEMERLGRTDVLVSSAGLRAFPGSPPDPRMVQYLETLGIAAPAHEARQVSPEDVDRADLIVVMEREHAREIARQWPGTGSKVVLLGTYLPGIPTEDDVVDPFGRSPYHYRLAQSQITLAVKSLSQRLSNPPESTFSKGD
ncbi:MAG: low molecular weight protein-tyrosine-phosphatase [Thermodesulfobacteriota bacterium]